MGRIVVGLDGSPLAMDALRWAARHAAATEATLELVSVVLPPVIVDPVLGAWTFSEAPEEGVERVQLEAIEELGLDPEQVTLTRPHGSPSRALLERAEGADLLVLGTRGHGTAMGLLVGSVAHQVATHTPCPLVVVPGESAAPRRIVAGVDGSEGALHALRWAADVARLHGAVLEVVGVFDRMTVPIGAPWAPSMPVVDLGDVKGALEEVIRESVRLADVGDLQVERSILEGPVGERLLDRGEDADLVVVGSRGRGGFAGLLLGSTTHRCLKNPPCPVAVVPGG